MSNDRQACGILLPRWQWCGREMARMWAGDGNGVGGKSKTHGPQLEGRKRKALRGRKPRSVSDQQFEERLRISERLVQALREAGYSCELGDDGPARALKR